MPARLLPLDGGPEISLDRVPIVVGRNACCDVRIASNRVSRRHCTISVVAGQVEVRDLGSSNGTLVNGRQVRSAKLHPGDILSIAGIHYRLDLGPAARLSWLIRLNRSGPSGDPPAS
jgi:pSer/pThr/pTyr-binding forkhead associated (FHA) protein